ncbi:unnamed protein product [Closterium sp. NIES-54]
MPTRSGLDFALKDRLAETEVMEGDGTNERELGTETDAHAVERGATRKLSRATGSDEERKLPRGAEKEGTKGGVEKPVSEEAATTTKGRRGSGRPYPRSASWQGFEEEAASMRWRYTMLPKVEVPERFAGEARRGPSLKNYVMQLENLWARWERDRLAAHEFFRGLANTLTREAETHYQICQ